MDLERARINDEKLLTAVGRLTVSWAHLEFALDSMIAVIHGLMDGKLHEKRLPLQLGEKVAYLRRSFDRLGIAEKDRPRYDSFLDDVETETVTRHDIIHGFPIHHPSDEGEAKLVRLIIGKQQWDKREVTITIDSVNAAADTVSGLAGKGANWVKVMVDLYESVHGPIPS